MEKEILWVNNIDALFCDFSYVQLDDFLEALDYSDKYNASMFILEDIYESEGLWNWLYTKDNYELNDVKRELQKWLCKIEKITNKQYADKKLNVGKNTQSKIILAGINSSQYAFCTLREYLNAIRSYLAMEKKDSFAKDLEECFPNLYFAPDIEASLNTLNRNFVEIRNEIVEHLTSLDSYNDNFLELHKNGKSNREISLQFKCDTGIECSPQANRGDTVNLGIILYNSISEKEEKIVCELHTKFNKYNIDKTKQDRIYFAPGRYGIEEGRTIIKHIGTHL